MQARRSGLVRMRRGAGGGGGISSVVVGKVPAVTLGFWLIKILATTLGETAGDVVSTSLDLGYAMGSVLFMEVFAAAVAAQIAVETFRPLLFWFAIVATTIASTTLADLADRSLGYGGAVALLCGLLVLSFLLLCRVAGAPSVGRITTPGAELFFWVTVLLSQTFGTALGDWVADTSGFGFGGAVLVFGGALAVVALVYAFTSVSRTALFWCAFVLTGPLGAALGEALEKPRAEGGLEINRLTVFASLLAIILLCVLWQPRRPAREPRRG